MLPMAFARYIPLIHHIRLEYLRMLYIPTHYLAWTLHIMYRHCPETLLHFGLNYSVTQAIIQQPSPYIQYESFSFLAAPTHQAIPYRLSHFYKLFTIS
jgi:hypothetical protein